MRFILKYLENPVVVYDDGGLCNELGIDVKGLNGSQVISILNKNGYTANIEAFDMGIYAGILDIERGSL